MAGSAVELGRDPVKLGLVVHGEVGGLGKYWRRSGPSSTTTGSAATRSGEIDRALQLIPGRRTRAPPQGDAERQRPDDRALRAERG